MFFGPKNFAAHKKDFKPKIFSDLKFFPDPKGTSMKEDLWREKTELLNLRLSKLARAKGLL